jgi:integrase/recombinase XerD
MNDGAAIDAFLEMMSAERGASANTLAAYRRDLEDAAEFVSGRGTRLMAASTDELRAYLGDLSSRGFAATSQARRLSALRQFCRFLYLEGSRPDDPTGTLDAPRRARGLPGTLSEAQVARLLDLARREAEGEAATAAEIRLHALVELLYASGLRVSELVSLPVSVAKRRERFFMVRGKGSKDRMVPLSGPAEAALARWIEVREAQPALAASPFLFPGQSASGHLPRQVFARDLKALGCRSGSMAPT